MEKIDFDHKIKFIEKQNEIDELKKKINTPKIYFESNKLWEYKKKEMFIIIENTVNECMLNDNYTDCTDDYENIVYNGLCSSHRITINRVLFNELNKLTEYKYATWCENIAWEIVYSIEGAVQGLIYTDKINDFKDYEMSEFIYKNIIWQLGDNTHFPSILDDIPIFCDKNLI
jgi:hypothetical protein